MISGSMNLTRFLDFAELRVPGQERLKADAPRSSYSSIVGTSNESGLRSLPTSLVQAQQPVDFLR